MRRLLLHFSHHAYHEGKEARPENFLGEHDELTGNAQILKEQEDDVRGRGMFKRIKYL
jgi:hypothetical protein